MVIEAVEGILTWRIRGTPCIVNRLAFLKGSAWHRSRRFGRDQEARVLGLHIRF